MKNSIAILLMFLAPVLLLGQESPLASFYAKHIGAKDFETIEVKPGSTAFDWEKGIQSAHIKDMIKDIQSIRILNYEGERKMKANKVWNGVKSAVKEGSYEEVVSFSKDGKQASVYLMKQSEGVLSEIALVAREKDEITVMAISGKIDLKKIFSPETMESLEDMVKYYLKDKRKCEVR